ncbi:ATP-binding protein [Agathobacter sp.]
MKYDTFLKEKERVAKLSVEEQKKFYAKLLEEETDPTSVRLQSYFQYAVLFYYEGNFKKTIEIMERFVISYQSYEYIPEMISCFNVAGVACQCEGDYILARHFYSIALKVCRQHNAANFYTYEYNNISLTYIAQKNYVRALEYIKLAEAWLPQSDHKMGAFIFLNRSDIYTHMGLFDKALADYEKCIREYDALNELPEDTMICGITLHYFRGEHEKCMEYVKKVIDRLENMQASEFIEACKVIFECSLKAENYSFVDRVIDKTDRYMQEHKDESKVGVQAEELKLNYARAIGDKDAMLAALEKKNYYYEQIVTSLEEHRVASMDEYLETHRHLQQAVHNERMANRAKTQFLANMSHDLRTPMNAIVGFTSLMENSVEDPEMLREYLAKIQLSSEYMLGMINDLLDMNMIENGEVHLNRKPVSLNDQIKQVEKIVRIQTEKKKQHFEVKVTEIKHDRLLADDVRLRHIMINILTNAVKYTPEWGSIELYIEECNCDKKDRAKFLFRINDTGIGMEKELIDHIFDPFLRGRESVINKIQGTGLGLSIVKNIVDMMGGNISIGSIPEEGTSVAVTLEFDIDREYERKNMLQSSDEHNILSGMNFLCAEDNELNAEILEALLQTVGATCTIYPDGQKIVNAFEKMSQDDKEDHFDAILMDIQMPNMNGYEAAKRIRAGGSSLGKNIPIIAMTANAFAEDIDNSLKAGMDAHISKPISMDILRRTMQKIIL